MSRIKMPEDIYKSETGKKVSIGVIFGVLGIMIGCYVTDFCYKHHLIKENGKLIYQAKPDNPKIVQNKTITLKP